MVREESAEDGGEMNGDGWLLRPLEETAEGSIAFDTVFSGVKLSKGANTLFMFFVFLDVLLEMVHTENECNFF